MFLNGLILLVMMPFFTLAADPVKIRRKDFVQHKNENQKFDQQRVKGLGDYLDDAEEWERQRLAALEAYRKEDHGMKKRKSQEKRMKDYKQYHEEAEEWQEGREKARQIYLTEHIDQLRQRDKYAREWARFEIEELDLFERPRYDTRKRVMYGDGSNKKRFKAQNEIGGGSGGSSGNDYIPPPPNFPSYDSVPYDGGDIPPPPPPPTFPEYDGGDVPPPPPLPPPDMGG